MGREEARILERFQTGDGLADMAAIDIATTTKD